MDKLDDYTYNFLSDHLSELEDERRDMRAARRNLIEKCRCVPSLLLTNLADLDAAIESMRQSLSLIGQAIDRSKE